jgi:hypothetical protein
MIVDPDSPIVTPKLGIFWRVHVPEAAPMLLVDSVPVTGAESYGDFRTHGGHYEFWSKLAAMSVSELLQSGFPDVVKWSEYEEWPRGRVVFHVLSNRFVIYADRKLRNPKIVQQIMQRFSLPSDRTDVRGDSHYVSVR